MQDLRTPVFHGHFAQETLRPGALRAGALSQLRQTAPGRRISQVLIDAAKAAIRNGSAGPYLSLQGPMLPACYPRPPHTALGAARENDRSNQLDFAYEFSIAAVTVDRGVGIMVKIIYSDRSGQPYESSFCYGRLVSGALNYCPDNNYIN
jgi:hypothetical protein